MAALRIIEYMDDDLLGAINHFKGRFIDREHGCYIDFDEATRKGDDNKYLKILQSHSLSNNPGGFGNSQSIPLALIEISKL